MARPETSVTDTVNGLSGQDSHKTHNTVTGDAHEVFSYNAHNIDTDDASEVSNYNTDTADVPEDNGDTVDVPEDNGDAADDAPEGSQHDHVSVLELLSGSYVGNNDDHDHIDKGHLSPSSSEPNVHIVYPEVVHENVPEDVQEHGYVPEVVQEHVPEVVQEHVPEVVQEHVPETEEPIDSERDKENYPDRYEEQTSNDKDDVDKEYTHDHGEYGDREERIVNHEGQRRKSSGSRYRNRKVRPLSKRVMRPSVELTKQSVHSSPVSDSFLFNSKVPSIRSKGTNSEVELEQNVHQHVTVVNRSDTHPLLTFISWVFSWIFS
jgi:hypothetical protein